MESMPRRSRSRSKRRRSSSSSSSTSSYASTTTSSSDRSDAPRHRAQRSDASMDRAPRLEVPVLPTEVAAYVDLFALAVVAGGAAVEDEVRAREANNPFFSFLKTWNDPIHVYYRWRVYSLLQGDSLKVWQTRPFQMQQSPESFVWMPPPVLPTGPAAAAERVPSERWMSLEVTEQHALYVTLPKEELAEWKTLINGRQKVATVPPEEWEDALLRAADIADCTVFAVEHSQAAYHLSAMLLDEFIDLSFSPSTDPHTLRLHALCMVRCLWIFNDVWHNGQAGGEGSPRAGASLPRALEATLPCVVEGALRMASLCPAVPIASTDGATMDVHIDAPRGDPRAVAMVPMLWVRGLAMEWHRVGLVTGKRWSLLMRKYEFILRDEESGSLVVSVQ